MNKIHVKFLGSIVGVWFVVGFVIILASVDCSTGNGFGGCNIASRTTFDKIATAYWGR